MTTRYADLHLHTVASDGTCTIAEQASRAKARALSCIAITDHDTMADELVAPVMAIAGMEVIAGVEIKADFDGVTGELLAYLVDPALPELRTFLAQMKAARIVRMEAMIRLCQEKLGVTIEMSELLAVASGNLGRPHLARVLVDRGEACNFREAFDELIGGDKPCYAPIEKASFRDVLPIVRAAGGVASLAHPCLMKIREWGAFLDDLADAGVESIETFYAYGNSTADLSIDPRLLTTMAVERGFLLTGGSDDHGSEPNSPKLCIGDVRVPYEHVEALKRKAASI